LLSGITPVWASEIEPFPIRVTTKRLPFMKHYGDVSRMDGGKIEPVDIIVADVSFISLTLILPPCVRWLKEGGLVAARHA